MPQLIQDSTTLTYNHDESILTLSVHEKPLHKYVFVLTPKGIVSCNICAFNNTKCDYIIRCLPNERKDEQNGYYKIID